MRNGLALAGFVVLCLAVGGLGGWATAQSVAECLGITAVQVNVKAKTAEKLGPVGEERSMEARAVVLLFPV